MLPGGVGVGLVWAVVGQTLDATSMALMVTTLGLSSELNPVVHSFGAGAALILKAALMLYLVVMSRLWRPSLRKPILVIACAAGLFGAVDNLWTML